MSRTRRVVLGNMRTPRTTSTLKMEAKALSLLLEEGFFPSRRLRARANPRSKAIPSAYDDIRLAAWDEMDYADRNPCQCYHCRHDTEWSMNKWYKSI